MFKLYRFASIITNQIFKKLSRFFKLKSRSPADGRISRPYQSDVTIIDKATATFHRKTHKKKCKCAYLPWLTGKNFEGESYLL